MFFICLCSTVHWLVLNFGHFASEPTVRLEKMPRKDVRHMCEEELTTLPATQKEGISSRILDLSRREKAYLRHLYT